MQGRGELRPSVNSFLSAMSNNGQLSTTNSQIQASKYPNDVFELRQSCKTNTTMNNPPHGPPGFDRDRERELEEQHRQRALQEEHLQREQRERERDHSERQERERQLRDQQQQQQYQPAPAHQNNTGSLPLHQPVASRLPGAIHSPGGLLATHNGVPPVGPLGAPSGPGNAFGGPLHSETNRPIQHNPQQATNQLQQQQGFGPNMVHHNAVGNPGGPVSFGGPLAQQQQAQQQQEAVARLQQALPFGAQIPQAHQMPGAPALGQGGQQPILNVSTTPPLALRRFLCEVYTPTEYMSPFCCWKIAI